MAGLELLKNLAEAFSFDSRRDADKFLQAVVATTPECIKVVGLNGDLLHMNAAGLEMIETDSWESVAGACTFNLVADEDRPEWLSYHQRVCAGERLAWEFDIIGLNGTRRHMETHAVPIELGDGSVGQLAITRDVSSRKVAEAALKRLNDELEGRVKERTRQLEDTLQRLQETERNFGLMVNSVTDYALYMLDPTGNVTSWNTGAERIKGYTAAEIIGRHFPRFYTEEDREAGRPDRTLAIALRDGRFESEGWRVRKDGTRFLANVVVDRIDDAGRHVGFAKITRDITGQRETEARLRQAQKMEAVGQFTGGAAHDFNNLLMAVLGSLELLRKRLPDDPRAAALLENAVQGARRGASLTQRMLAFARRQDLQQEPVDLPALVHGMRELLDQTVTANIRIETHLPRSLPRVMTDPGQLETALLNLIVNARDAMPHGGTVTIAARAADVAEGQETDLAAGSYVCLLVQDQGQGMDAATLARVTEPFFTTKGIGKGTGLGLPMVDGLAAQSGGKLKLVSEPGSGTTAELWLPLALLTPEHPDRPEPRSEQVELKAQSLTILAVDDDALVLMNTVGMLEDMGHKVREAGSGAEALKILASGGIDLMITDHAMPGLTGIELAKAAQALNADLPIILATGYAELPNGMDTGLLKLNKPFMQNELAQAVAKARDSL